MSCKILNFPNLAGKNLNFPNLAGKILNFPSLASKILNFPNLAGKIWNFPNVARRQDMEFSKSCNFLICCKRPKNTVSVSDISAVNLIFG